MGDHNTVNDKDAAAEYLRRTVSKFLRRNCDQNPTWNYLAAVQTHSDLFSGDLVIGNSQDVILPIDNVGV